MKQRKITKGNKEKQINNTDFKETNEFLEAEDDTFEEVDEDLETEDDAFEEVDERAEIEENDFTEADAQDEEVPEVVDNIEEYDESENEDLFTSQDDFTSEIINLDDKTDKKKNKKGKKVLWITLGSIAGVIAIVYLGISFFFMSHYYINTEINGHDFSMKTATDVEKYMKDQVKNYSLTVLEMEQAVDIIDGDTIDLEYKASDEAEAAIKDQNAFLWPAGIFSKKSCHIKLEVSYDESKLQQEIQNLQTVTREQIEPKSAYPKFDGNQFVIEPEVKGTAVDQDVLNEKINQYITEFKSELDMEKEGC